jgi:hypothetical protein
MLLAIALLLLATLSAAIVSYAYDDDVSFPVRLAYGVATGFAALALIGFIGAQVGGITAGTGFAAVLLALPLLALRVPRFRSRLRADWASVEGQVRAAVAGRDGRAMSGLVYSVVSVVFLAIVFERVIVLKDGGVFTGYVNNLGDLPFHMQVASSFAFGQNFPPEDPTYAGTNFAYPYLSDFLGAMLVNLGASLRDAFFVQNLALALALIAVLYRFVRVLTLDRLAGYLAPVLLLFSGGLGWTVLIGDAQRSGQGLLAAMGSLQHDYSITSDGPYRFGNAITTLLVTQRSLLSGLPLALVAFVLLWRMLQAPPPEALTDARPRARAWRFAVANRVPVAAGIATGLLPIIHAHSFVVVLGTAFLLGLLFQQWRDRRWQPWAVYVIVALTLALPQIWWSTRDSVANAGMFFGVEFGWDHGDENIAWFWFLNTGLFIPLALIGAWWLWSRRDDDVTLTRADRHRRAAVVFCAVFVTWFIVPNALRLAPWIWDNIKVLLYGFVGALPLVAYALSRLLRSRGTWRVAGALALASLILAGTVDVWRVISRQTEYQEFDRDGVALADVIRAATPPRALVLHAPTYNPPVFLTGRRSLLGYTGYIWAHGLDYAGREEDIKKIYAGDADANTLLKQYGVDYVAVTPLERAYMTVNDAYFAKLTMVGEAGDYRLYEVPK